MNDRVAPPSDLDRERTARMRPPSDEEIMLFADDRLRGARAREVGAFVRTVPEARAWVEAMRTAGDAVALDAFAAAAASPRAVEIADRVEARLFAGTSAPPRAGTRRAFAATFGLAAMAASVAFGLRFGHADDARPSAALDPVAPEGAAARLAELAAPPSTAVERVDFGGHSGSIFYVPSGAATTTAVVWLTEDAPGTDDGAR